MPVATPPGSDLTHPDPTDFAGLPIQPTGSGVADEQIAFEQAVIADQPDPEEESEAQPS